MKVKVNLNTDNFNTKDVVNFIMEEREQHRRALEQVTRNKIQQKLKQFKLLYSNHPTVEYIK